MERKDYKSHSARDNHKPLCQINSQAADWVISTGTRVQGNDQSSN